MTTSVKQDTTERDRHCDGLQALVDLLRAHPELRSPFDRVLRPVHSKDEIADWARALSHLRPAKGFDDKYASVTAHFADVELFVYGSRENVCERIVTGVTTVTKTVKDPEMLKAVPEVEITEQVETVGWICSALLAVSA